MPGTSGIRRAISLFIAAKRTTMKKHLAVEAAASKAHAKQL